MTIASSTGRPASLRTATTHAARPITDATERSISPLMIRQEVAKRAATEAVKQAKASGLSDEAADLIRQKILGVV